MRIDPSPPRVGLATVYFQLTGVNGPICIEGDMAHPGMAPIFGTATPDGTGGQYKGQLDLNMPGDWVILVKAKSTDGRVIEQQFPITVSEK